MVGVREATGSGDSGDRQIALGQQRGRTGEPQQLECGHRADAEPASKDPAQMAGRQSGGSGELIEDEGACDAGRSPGLVDVLDHRFHSGG